MMLVHVIPVIPRPLLSSRQESTKNQLAINDHLLVCENIQNTACHLDLSYKGLAKHVFKYSVLRHNSSLRRPNLCLGVGRRHSCYRGDPGRLFVTNDSSSSTIWTLCACIEIRSRECGREIHHSHSIKPGICGVLTRLMSRSRSLSANPLADTEESRAIAVGGASTAVGSTSSVRTHRAFTLVRSDVPPLTTQRLSCNLLVSSSNPPGPRQVLDPSNVPFPHPPREIHTAREICELIAYVPVLQLDEIIAMTRLALFFETPLSHFNLGAGREDRFAMEEKLEAAPVTSILAESEE
ncbi:uncharacterized protein EDB91DRAFT_1086108 [Suillus paluster]|uniref:uncharacterized protein n=1 Tax=Suillus paluster TaxID=48578 RepID=UPI001B87CB0F|nr:uncharacterized protein EDB91DRAFT_1086108 [Suillus paluster]KAG1728373.1 hypothetical protein EDB91DRAFT_1086108 [Suillus paluster]